MNQRIKIIRENNNLTQEEFGKKIGSARNTITNYESGNRTPSNSVIISICREFNINEEWLRTGQGEMYKKSKEMYRSNIQSMIDKIDDIGLLKRIYALAEYLYIYKAD